MRRPGLSPVLSFPAFSLLGPLILVACGSDGGTDPVDPFISLSPSTASMYSGDEVTLTATVTGTSAPVSFNSTAPGVARVDATGKVTGVTPGAATITASADGASASAQITVNESIISVEPQAPSVLPGETIQLSATITGGSGHAVSWATDDAEIAVVDGTGLVTAISPGSTPITASIDGQAGVEDAVTLDVLEPAPTAEIVSFIDALGNPLDLENVSGIFFANFEISGYVGTQAAVELYFDDELFASVPFTVDGPQPASVSGPLLKRELAIQEVPLAINTFAQEDLDGGLVSKLPDNLYRFAPSIRHNGELSGVPIRGIGNTADITIRGNPPVAAFTNTFTGEPILVDGRSYTNGDVETQLRLGFPSATDLQRVEVIRGPQGTLFGRNTTAGVINFTTPRTEFEGYEGALSYDAVKVYEQGGGFQQALIANNFPEFFDNLPLEEFVYVDYSGPTASSTPISTEELIIGASTDLQSHLSLKANFGPNDFSDVTGVSSFRWQFSASAGSWDVQQNYQLGAQLSQTNGFTTFASAYADDGFGQGTRALVEDGSGSYRRVAVDLTSPTLALLPGSWNVSDLAGIHTQGDWQLQVDAVDPPPSGFSWSSGINPSGFDLRMKYRTPSLEQYLYGNAETLERVSFDLQAGWQLPWSVAGEYHFDVKAHDLALNGSEELSVNVVYNRQGPVLTVPTLTGLDSENHFAAGSTVGIQVSAQDAVENYLATAGTFSPTANLYHFSDIVQVGTPFDGSFQNDSDLELTLQGFIPRVEFTEGPLAGTGWHPFSHAGAGVINTSGLTAISLAEILGNLPPAGPTFNESQLVSWFPDQTLTELCLGSGPECKGRSQIATVSARGWVPAANGLPTLSEGELYAMKFGPGGENMFRRVGGLTPVDIVPFGASGHEVQLSMTFNVLEADLNERYDRLFWGVRSPAGDVYATRWWPLVIRTEF